MRTKVCRLSPIGRRDSEVMYLIHALMCLDVNVNFVTSECCVVCYSSTDLYLISV